MVFDLESLTISISVTEPGNLGFYAHDFPKPQSLPENADLLSPFVMSDSHVRQKRCPRW